MYRKVLVCLLLIAVIGGVFNFQFNPKTLALAGSDFIAGRIMDDAVFFNPNTLSQSDIQAVLNAKVPTCDTNGSLPKAAGSSQTRAQWAAANGKPAPPYICLRDYSQDVSATTADNYCNGTVSSGTKTAAQIIYEVAQACGVSPKVLIVLLEKEQNLVTDDWPWPIQYQSATGYGCPDTAACDSAYYGFFNQVYNAARQFQRYVKQSSLFNYVSGQTAFVKYNPNAACGGTDIAMQNQATAGLYNYTPYQPNTSALNNLYGSGDACGAYGNRNFWRLYIDWFGSTLSTVPNAWLFEGQAAFSDSARSKTFTSVPTVNPGGKLYLRVKARNMGTSTWSQSNIRLGTSRPNDRVSPFADSSWTGPTRPATLMEATIPPGQIGTFEFSLTAPTSAGTYNEYYNVLNEGVAWMNDLGLYFSINVNAVSTPSSANVNTLKSGETLNIDDYLISPEGQSIFTLQRNGALSLYSNFSSIWSRNLDVSATRIVMQTDGNLVVYNQAGQSLWNAGTQNNPGASLILQTDGNLVIYAADGTSPLWSTATSQVPDHLSYVNTYMSTSGNAGRMYPGQSIDTADGRFHLIFQRDGNLVLYSPTKAVWSNVTTGKGAAFLALQSDGNLVMYDRNSQPVWYSGTSSSDLPLKLTVQQDGNMVLYDRLNRPVWNTITAGSS